MEVAEAELLHTFNDSGLTVLHILLAILKNLSCRMGQLMLLNPYFPK
jgi:hypothetical protein